MNFYEMFPAIDFYDSHVRESTAVIDVRQTFPFLRPAYANVHVYADFREEDFNKVPDIFLNEITDKWSSVRGGTVIDLGIDVRSKIAMQAFNALKMALRVNYKVRDSFHPLVKKWFDMNLSVYPDLNEVVFSAEDILCGEYGDAIEEQYCFFRNEEGHLVFGSNGWRSNDYAHFTKKKSEMYKVFDLHVFRGKSDGIVDYENAYYDCILKHADELMNDPRLFRKALSNIMKKYILPLFEIKDRAALLDKVTSKEAVLCFCGMLEGEDYAQLQMNFPEAFIGLGISTIKSSAFAQMDFKLVKEAKEKMHNMIRKAKKDWQEKRQRLIDEVDLKMSQELLLVAEEVKNKLLAVELNVNTLLKKHEENGEQTPAEEYMQTRVMSEVSNAFNHNYKFKNESSEWKSEQ